MAEATPKSPASKKAPAGQAKTSAAAKSKAAPKKTAAKAPPAAGKASAAKKPAPRQAEKKSISGEQRYRMIAEAAYFRAERCHFKSDPVRDWIEAERDIALLLGERNK